MRKLILFLSILLAASVLSFSAVSEAKSDKKKDKAAATAPAMSPQQEKDVAAAKERAKVILIGGGFTKDEARAAFRIFVKYGYNEIAIRREVRALKDDGAKREIRKKFGANTWQIKKELGAKVSPEAVVKFEAFLKEEREKRAAAQKK